MIAPEMAPAQSNSPGLLSRQLLQSQRDEYPRPLLARLGYTGRSDVLLLRGGEILAGGRKSTILTSGNLSIAYDAPVQVIQSNGRYQLKIK